jgi:hypothetical protein
MDTFVLQYRALLSNNNGESLYYKDDTAVDGSEDEIRIDESSFCGCSPLLSKTSSRLAAEQLFKKSRWKCSDSSRHRDGLELKLPPARIIDQDVGQLYRSVEQQTAYDAYRHDIQATYQSVYDHILITKFNFHHAQSTDGLIYSIPSLSQVRSVDKVVCPNLFPYFVEDGIVHYSLWKLGGDCTADDVREALPELEKIVGGMHDFLYWINPPHLKILPGIDHVHFLCFVGLHNSTE